MGRAGCWGTYRKKPETKRVYRRPELVVAKDDDEKSDEVTEEHRSIDVHGRTEPRVIQRVKEMSQRMKAAYTRPVNATSTLQPGKNGFLIQHFLLLVTLSCTI